jgi:hypothetical protein
MPTLEGNNGKYNPRIVTLATEGDDLMEGSQNNPSIHNLLV